MKRLACAVLGHRWAEAADVQETYPVLRCRRCGKTRALAAREVNPAWVGRGKGPPGSDLEP